MARLGALVVVLLFMLVVMTIVERAVLRPYRRRKHIERMLEEDARLDEIIANANRIIANEKEKGR